MQAWSRVPCARLLLLPGWTIMRSHAEPLHLTLAAALQVWSSAHFSSACGRQVFLCQASPASRLPCAHLLPCKCLVHWSQTNLLQCNHAVMQKAAKSEASDGKTLTNRALCCCSGFLKHVGAGANCAFMLTPKGTKLEPLMTGWLADPSVLQPGSTGVKFGSQVNTAACHCQFSAAISCHCLAIAIPAAYHIASLVGY